MKTFKALSGYPTAIHSIHRLLLALALLPATAPVALPQFVAFNDHVKGVGSAVHATAYVLSPGVSSGPLKNITNGLSVPVTLTITNYNCQGNSPAEAITGGPAYATFNNYVNFSGSGIQMGNTAAVLGHILTGLNPRSRYSLKGSSNRGDAAYTNRWTLFELLGADSFKPVHSDYCLTNNPDQGVSMDSNQVAICTGMNTTTGAMFDWEEIDPGPDGQVVIISRKYSGFVPNGSNNLSAYVYGLTGLRVEETHRLVTITNQPKGGIILPGTFHFFTVAASGTPPLYYQWQKDGTNIPNATIATYLIPSANSNHTGVYSVIVSNSFSSMVSTNVELLVGYYPPVIVVEPVDCTQMLGQPFSFSVAATGVTPLSYQWFRDSEPITGATNLVYAKSSSVDTDAGTYFVRVSNSVNMVTSAPVSLVLTGAPISIITQPADLSLTEGQTASLFVGVTGSEPAYQWFRSDNAIPNATNSAHSFAPARLSDTAYYYVVVSNLFGAVTSQTVLASVALPRVSLVTTGTVWRYNDTGQDLGTLWMNPAFDDSAWSSGVGPLAYPAGEALVSGLSVRTTLSAPGNTAFPTYYFRTEFTIPNPQSGMSLLVSNLIDDGAVFYLNGQELKRVWMPPWNIAYGSLADRTAEVYADGWFTFSIGGHLIQSGTNTLAVEVHQVNSSSSDVVLASLWTAVYPAPSPLRITNQPSSQVIAEGESVVLSVAVEGGAGEYQWLKMQGGSAAPVPNATGPSLVFSNPLVGIDDGDYFVTVSNVFGQVTSATATLTITSTAPVITSQPLSQSVCEGDAVKFEVTAYGSPTINYQWRHNDIDIPDATNSTHFIPSVLLSQAGTYSVTVSNPVGANLSTPALLRAASQTPIIITQPSDFVGNVAGHAVFSVEAAACSMSYQWQFNGTNINMATGPTLVLSQLSSAKTGDYTVIVRTAFGAVTSAVARLSLLNVSFDEAVGTTNLTWAFTYLPWFVQGSVVHDGVAALQAFPAADCWLRTDVVGPGKIEFWWKSAADTNSQLDFLVDARRVAVLTGTNDWEKRVYYVSSGSHALEWKFESSSTLGSPSTAWLDHIIWISNLPPTFTQPISDAVTRPGDNITFRGLVEGCPPISYQWLLNGTNLAGNCEPVLTLNDVQSHNQGTYTLLASNEFGTAALSASLTLTNGTPVFHTQPARVLAVPGGDAFIRAGAFGNSPLSYQWRFGTTDLPGQTNSVLTLHDLTDEHAGRYSVRVQNEFGISIGPEIELVVHPVSHVIHVSMDGLGGTYLDEGLRLEPDRYPNFMKMVNEGSTTCNARCDYENSVTLPNHISMITGRPVAQPQWKPNDIHHGYTADTSLPGTLHNNGNLAVPYKASVFDVVHDHGFSSMIAAGKSKFSMFIASYNENTGAPDLIPPDNGRNKIDRFLLFNDGVSVIDAAVPTLLNSTPFNYCFLHLPEQDTSGHTAGWGSLPWFYSLEGVDRQLGRLLSAIETHPNPDVQFGTVLLLTADHGGEVVNHWDASLPNDYTVPVFAWGPGFPAGTDIYTLFANRADPGTNRLDYNAQWQPLRNGDTGNLALSVLGLPPIPGSFMLPLSPSTPWLTAVAENRTVEWAAAATRFHLESSPSIGADANWSPVTEGIITNGTILKYPLPTEAGRRFYRLSR